MTPNREDYIKTVYLANANKAKITNKMIAHKLEVSPASVSEMIHKLTNSHHLTKDDELGIRLSDKGSKEARELLKKHRLWEVFLVNYLGYSWSEVHDDAEILEHVTSDKLAARLNDFLDKPEYCPHGSAIYGNVDDEDNEKVPLSSLFVNHKGVISEVNDHKMLLDYIEGIGLEIGAPFEVVGINDYDKSFKLKIDSRIISITPKATEEIYVIST